MKTLFYAALFGAVFLTGCEDQPEATEPIADEPASVADPATTTGFGDWDADDSGIVDVTEFGQSPYYSDWNSDAAEGLTEDEFGTGIRDAGLFGDWDADDDNRLTEDEFGFDREWFGEWDANDDNFLDEAELSGGAYGAWDADNNDLLVEEEFETGLFDAWDADDTNAIEEAEYTERSGWFD